MLAAPTIANVVLMKQGYHRRKRAGFNVHTKRPPQMRMDRPEERQVSLRRVNHLQHDEILISQVYVTFSQCNLEEIQYQTYQRRSDHLQV
jgi:hypothetical protein